MKWNSGKLYGQPEETQPVMPVEWEASCPTELVNEYSNSLTKKS
jgi:hypothetical protein